MKQIIIAENAGFCFGVKRAMNMAWKELEDNKDIKIYALGPLIHNKQAVSRYEDKGLITVEDMDEIQGDELEMIIRSHGVSKVIYENANEREIKIIDTTCPFVKKIHNIVENNSLEGKQIVVIGDKKHPEIIGINGWCDNKAIIVKNLEEAVNIDFSKNIEYVVVAQTTMNEDVFDKIIEYFNSLNLNIKIENTICSATSVRQQSAKNLAEKADFMIVIGGKHSSNTQKLVDICKSIVDTIAIETKDELKEINFEKYDVVGVTAGASTPDWIIEEALTFLESIKR